MSKSAVVFAQVRKRPEMIPLVAGVAVSLAGTVSMILQGERLEGELAVGLLAPAILGAVYSFAWSVARNPEPWPAEWQERILLPVWVVYFSGAIVAAVVTFFGGWIYAVMEWGILLGGGLGWIPALCLAVVAGAMWPFLALGGWLLWDHMAR